MLGVCAFFVDANTIRGVRDVETSLVLLMVSQSDALTADPAFGFESKTKR